MAYVDRLFVILLQTQFMIKQYNSKSVWDQYLIQLFVNQSGRFIEIRIVT